MVKAPYYPIIYLRGYAATEGEMRKTVATPYMGFNLGSTKLRQDYRGNIKRFIFESPLIRLMKDEKYVDAYANGDFVEENKKVPAKSVWIFRYYEDDETVGEGGRKTIEEWAVELRKFILRIRKQVCMGSAKDRNNFRVYLVAHSMGGLICRCYLQNICRYGIPAHLDDGTLKPQIKPIPSGEVPFKTHMVDKAFTYGTPHNGIDIQGINVPDWNDPLDVSNFNRDRIREYLKIPADQPANSLMEAFPARRFFCFVGTNYEDYHAFLNLSKKGVGPMSDGLVRIKNAVVEGAPRAFAHRSHSGDYGIVNSEEGYQNLRRFLFGDWFVDARLHADAITLPTKIEEIRKKHRNKFKGSYNIESSLCVRGGQYYLHERKCSQWSADLQPYDRFVKDKHPAYLFSTVLLNNARPNGRKSNEPLVFVLKLEIPRPLYEVDRKFWFDEHIEGASGWCEYITFYIYPNRKNPIQYGFGAHVAIGEADTTPDLAQNADGSLQAIIPLESPPGSFFKGSIELTIRHWNT